MGTKLYMLTETSAFMMSFVVETAAGRLIVIDGGREEDMPLLSVKKGFRKSESLFALSYFTASRNFSTHSTAPTRV